MITQCAFNLTSYRIDESVILCCYRLPTRPKQGVTGVIFGGKELKG
jgi:hypothetical protein